MIQTPIYLGATTLIALGRIGELDRLTSFDGRLIALPRIRAEVTTEPARTNLERFIGRAAVETTPSVDLDDGRAMDVLGEREVNGDVRLVAAVLAHTDADAPVGVVSDDRRVRTVARGFGARVTGTIGVVVRAVEEGLPADEGKAIVRRLDDHGLHMTAELHERAFELLEAADDRDVA